MADPYLPPAAPLEPPLPTPKCPACGAASATKVNLTLWGGAVGPRLFQVVRCDSCRAQYNGRTGASLTGVISRYQAIVFGLIGAAGGTLLALRLSGGLFTYQVIVFALFGTGLGVALARRG